MLRTIDKAIQQSDSVSDPIFIPENIGSDDLFKDLEIEKRTQKPPSEELIDHLNQLASKPPFSYVYKVKTNYPL